MSCFDWSTLMQAGLRGLRLHPRDFWALTPAELMVMLGSENGATPLSRTGLDELLKAYPDHIGGKQDDGN